MWGIQDDILTCDNAYKRVIIHGDHIDGSLQFVIILRTDETRKEGKGGGMQSYTESSKQRARGRDIPKIDNCRDGISEDGIARREYYVRMQGVLGYASGLREANSCLIYECDAERIAVLVVG
jgi:hypothetical protein